jgi:hypothetical protein
MTEHTSPIDSDEQTAPDMRAQHSAVRCPCRKTPAADSVITQEQLGQLKPFIENDDDPGFAAA